MKPRIQNPLALCVFTLAYVLRLSFISLGPYHIDCLFLAIQAEKTLETGLLQPLYGFGYPVTVALGTAFVQGFRSIGWQDSILAVNLMSVVTSSLAVAAFYCFTRRLFNPKAALFSTALFLVNPIFLGVSVYGKSHAPA